MLLWFLLACADDPTLAAEMQRGLARANDAVVAATVTAELARWIDAEATTTLRHSTGCGCPCREQAGDDDGQLWLDYAELGCYPDSDLLPWPTRGRIVVQRDRAEAVLDPQGVVLDRRIEIGGGGTATRGATPWVQADLQIGPLAVGTDLTVTYAVDRVTFDGTLDVDGEPVELHQVEVALVDVFGDCPIPSEGHLALAGLDGPIEVWPVGDGQAEATYVDRVSDRVGWCAFRPGWW